jgi:hypothetical protein
VRANKSWCAILRNSMAAPLVLSRTLFADVCYIPARSECVCSCIVVCCGKCATLFAPRTPEDKFFISQPYENRWPPLRREISLLNLQYNAHSGRSSVLDPARDEFLLVLLDGGHLRLSLTLFVFRETSPVNGLLDT